MIEVRVKKVGSDTVKWQGRFKTQREADLWVLENSSQGAWGKAGEFVVEIEDLTAKLESDRLQKETKRKRIDDLSKKNMTLAELQEAVKLIIEKIGGL